MDLKGAAELQNQIPHCGVSPYRLKSQKAHYLLPPHPQPTQPGPQGRHTRATFSALSGPLMSPSWASAPFSLALLLLPCLSKPFVLPAHMAWQAVFASLQVQWMRRVQEKCWPPCPARALELSPPAHLLTTCLAMSLGSPTLYFPEAEAASFGQLRLSVS